MPVNTCKVCGKLFKCHSWNTATCDDCLEAGFKYCTSCGTAKPVSEFHFRKGKPYICNTCHYAKCRKSNKSTNYQAKLNERYRTDGAKADLTMDHVAPVSQGGETTVGNIIPACRSCNSSKGAKDMIEWYTVQPFYDKDRLEAILKYLRKVGDAK